MAPKDSIANGEGKKYAEIVAGVVDEEDESEEWDSDESSEEEESEEGEDIEDPNSELREENRRLTLQLIEDKRLLKEANQQLDYIKRLVEEKREERDNWRRMLALGENQGHGENGQDRQQA